MATALTPTTVPLVDQVASDGTRLGAYSAGLLTTPRGRYGQFTFTFPVGLTTEPWIGDMTLYSWVPERDPQFMDKAALASVPHVIDPPMQAVYALPALMAADNRQATLDFISAYSIGGATDQYLAQYGQDLGLPPYAYSLIPPGVYQTLAQLVFGSRPEGGSPTFIAQGLGEVVGGIPPTLTSSVTTSGLQTITASSSALTTGNVVVAQTAAWAASITIPPATGSGQQASYPGMPGVPIALAQTILTAIITKLTPLGVALTTTYQ
jgi:hypothetical protein